jgi:diguanylate cyclase (GGDEF)-like protein/PAS domain S-box-containing protein
MIAEDNAITLSNSDARILLTDDDPRMLDSLRSLLQLHDYQIDIAQGGEQAKEKLRNNHYDLLLLDLRMPDVTGHDVMRWMNKQHIQTMTIVVSGETSLDDISKALRQGAYDYLKKPYVPEELLATVNNAIRKKRLEDAHRQMQEQLNRSEKLHRFIVNNSPDIIFILDSEGRFSFLNSKVEEVLGFSREELMGKPISNLINEDDLEKANYFIKHSSRKSSRHQSIDICLKPKQSQRSKRHFEFSLWPIENNTSRRRYCLYGTAREITERLEAEAFINFQAYHDLLTRLPNRALFKDRLSVSITQVQRNNRHLAVMFIDLDRFKIVNDSLGHTMGDRLLQEVSKRLQKCIRKGDTLSRFGGDEFTLLLPDINSQKDATLVAEKILEHIKEPFQLSEHQIHVGASIGIATYPEAGEDMDTLIKHADIAMYRVKKTGKDGYRVFSDDLITRSTERLLLEQDMRKAIDNHEFEVCYQPQINIREQRICGVEALVRWDHPTLGRLPPSEFIPIAEDSQLIVELDRLTLRTACREMLIHHQQDLPDVQLSVNLSPIMIEKNGFVDGVLAILREENYPPHLLELEITENVLMNDNPEIIEKLMRLSDAGIRLALDDFGTGYSSLSYLQKFPLNTIKIDRSFINAIQDSQEEACIVNAIVSMAQGLKMSIVAEGVENYEQYRYLHSLDCEVVQGYLFGKATQLHRVADMFNSDLLLIKETTQEPVE